MKITVLNAYPCGVVPVVEVIGDVVDERPSGLGQLPFGKLPGELDGDAIVQLSTGEVLVIRERSGHGDPIGFTIHSVGTGRKRSSSIMQELLDAIGLPSSAVRKIYE